MTVALYLHTRDLRLTDNITLHTAIQENNIVQPVFILNPDQLDPDKNKYFSGSAVAFMLSSVLELKQKYKNIGYNLPILEGLPWKVLADQARDHPKLYISADYTPYSKYRTEQLVKCGFEVIEIHNHLTFHPDQMKTQTGKYYEVYTPFWNSYQKQGKPKLLDEITDQITNEIKFKTVSDLRLKSIINEYYTPDQQPGGRTAGLALMNKVTSMKYNSDRNTASIYTSRLSAHIKFGTVSIREVYHHSPDLTYTSQLAWHDFYTLLAVQIGEQRTFGQSNYRRLNFDWPQDDEAYKLFELWKEGKTGYPIIDAGMRQLSKEHWQHNRLRLLCSNFLVFGLGLDWRWGEQWYAQNLIDYDPCINNGNWQWSAGVGIDRPRQWPRTYNLYKQSQESDPDCGYQRKYVPEIRKLTNNQIHKLNQGSDSAHVIDYDTNKAYISTIYKSNE